MMRMVRTDRLLAGDFLRGKELKGKEHIVKIVYSGEFMKSKYPGPKGTLKEQLVIGINFHGVIRKLGMNKTSVKRIALEYSADTDNWVDKRLRLVPETRIIAEKETIVIWAYPLKEDSIKENLFSFSDEEKG